MILFGKRWILIALKAPKQHRSRSIGTQSVNDSDQSKKSVGNPARVVRRMAHE